MQLALGELPEIYADCEAALLPRRQSLLRPVGCGTRRTSGPPLDEEAMATRSDILGILSSWAALVADERKTGAPRRRPDALAAFLLTHLNWLLAHTAAKDFMEEILDTTENARRSACVKASLATVRLGRCVLPGCEEPLSPAPASDRAAGNRKTGEHRNTTHVRCAAGHTWLPHQWLELLRELRKSRHPAEGVA
ncbi:hypothetical protein [Streptomyces sp. I05A-00742]|uniref:hypothetical protein n=1 Tax=Streptomyces sp. I05A-00742 TaxID=2732853 RepID=UPI0014898EDC|nr:hypothetical protein [Streptomyces sp. I05A-00742]